MTKNDIAKHISTTFGFTEKQAKEVVGETLDFIVGKVQEGKEVRLNDFGVFEPRERSARTAYHPGSGEPIDVPKRTVPYFRPFKYFKEAVDQ